MSSLYFAYGSNMSTLRLRARIEGARPVGAAWLADHRLVCNKRGKDGSGKANLVSEPGEIAWGVLFAIAHEDWGALDRYEWGYRRSLHQVFHIGGGSVSAQLYLASEPEGGAITPYDWYRRHCVEGAREHGLPLEIIASIEAWSVRSARSAADGEDAADAASD